MVIGTGNLLDFLNRPRTKVKPGLPGGGGFFNQQDSFPVIDQDALSRPSAAVIVRGRDPNTGELINFGSPSQALARGFRPGADGIFEFRGAAPGTGGKAFPGQIKPIEDVLEEQRRGVNPTIPLQPPPVRLPPPGIFPLIGLPQPGLEQPIVSPGVISPIRGSVEELRQTAPLPVPLAAASLAQAAPAKRKRFLPSGGFNRGGGGFRRGGGRSGQGDDFVNSITSGLQFR